MNNGIQMLADTTLLGIAGLLAGEAGSLHLQSISLKSWLAADYLVVAGSLIGFSAYTWLIRNARTTLVSTYAYVNPVVAVLLGAAFASEPITARTLIAGAIILAGVAMIVARPARPVPATPPATPPEPVATPPAGNRRTQWTESTQKRPTPSRRDRPRRSAHRTTSRTPRAARRRALHRVPRP